MNDECTQPGAGLSQAVAIYLHLGWWHGVQLFDEYPSWHGAKLTDKLSNPT